MGLAHELQMSWQPSLLSEKRKRGGPPLGLRNLGNSCYLNSVLQCLTYTPPLANFCLKLQHSSLCKQLTGDSALDAERKRECPFCILEKRIVRSLSVDLTLDAPAKIQSCLRIFAEHFKCGRQEDAHEFLRYVIDACHNTCLRLKKLRRKGGGGGGGGGETINGGSSVVKEIFGGALQSQVKCLACGAESNKVDEIMDISLDILNSCSLKEAMQKFFQPEVLDGNNKYKCDNCKKLVSARKQMSILQSPNILVIQLKRFEGIFGGKIDKAIAFEEVLVLSSFMCKASQDPQPEYKLFGTIVHSGFSPDSGHYYAYIKDAIGRWYCCNDSYVSVSTLQEVLSEKVYILFFIRANQRPVSANGTFASNGVKSHKNGKEAYKGVKGTVPLKAVATKPSAEQLSRKTPSTISKVEKVPSNPRLKFSISGSSGCKGVPPTSNGKVNVHKSQSVKMNGVVKDSVPKEKSGKDPFINTNGSYKSKRVDLVGRGNDLASVSTSENGDTQSVGLNPVKPDPHEGNCTSSRTTAGRVPDPAKLLNGSVKFDTDISGSKRKSQESCILLAQDSESLAKLQELEEVLKKEASSVLRSCGWSEKVLSYMRSRKRQCAHEVGITPGDIDLKKLLIRDAKSTFLSQIPNSLKDDLVKHLRSCSDGKRGFPVT
ncbi:hypothetical protein AB3S75_027863 [Citrus x aurantiifolia]